MGYSKIPRGILSGILLLVSVLAIGQVEHSNLPVETDSQRADTLPRPDYRKLHRIFAVQSAAYMGSVYVLSKSWYKNPLTQFHVRDDRHVWLQMDKLGHVFTSYQISRYTSEIYRGTGISRKQRILYGALSGFVFQTPIELLDGFSPDYGFSPSDVLANLLGSAVFAGQMFAWDEVRIHPKFSAKLTHYASLRPELLGRTTPERILKDYNGQTYWLSSSPGAFFPGLKWPSWLCLSLGYGIDNMVSAEFGKSVALGHTPRREYYLSIDVDLTRLPVRNPFLRTVALMLNSVKVPAPAIGFRRGTFTFHPLYF